ncbi:MAG: response regulator [Candidatus Tectomicrobia bacterium]|uniref:Response regulator n=1 Tax=Tectimicrobiota bacterium TaxID=2528274 RepID=A0A932CST7_UNCTE|nr:response regulator [Candidatus Tectomicrobia bacterium]
MKKRPQGEKANGRRILVVDDDEVVRAVVVEALDLFGYQAEAVSSGEEALAAFDEACHALLITDYRMPGMLGSELIQALRRRCPSLPTIALTSAEADEELRAAGAFEILRKPFELGRFREAVETGLHQAKREKIETRRQEDAVPILREG